MCCGRSPTGLSGMQWSCSAVCASERSDTSPWESSPVLPFAPLREDLIDLLKRRGIDARDTPERFFERDNRQQHDADREREACGHKRLGAGVPHSEQKAEADRDCAAAE